MNPDDYLKALNRTEADLLWLVIDDRWTRARNLLNDRDMQAAIIAAQRYDRPIVTGTGTDISDPTFDAVARGTATEIRAGKVVSVWVHELRRIAEHVAYYSETTATTIGDPSLPAASKGTSVVNLVASCSKRISWMSQIPHDRIKRTTGALDDAELDEWEFSITEAARLASGLRDGRMDRRPLSEHGHPVPSVYAVLEAARQTMRQERDVEPEPKPKQKPLEGCVSCARDGGYFEPIDTKNHNVRSMCRRCGDYTSGEGAWPPLAAVQYAHRTGKNWTWKVIEEAKRAERRAG